MPKLPKDRRIVSPFTIATDTRESIPYTFSKIHADYEQSKGRPDALIEVPTVRACLTHGDYSIFGYPKVGVERKSLSDLFGSIAKRANFEGRLERMSANLDYAAVVVEAEIFEIMERPPAFSSFLPKSLMRTILAWDQRYSVRWWFLPGRDAAEVWTYRILERYWKDKIATGLVMSEKNLPVASTDATQ